MIIKSIGLVFIPLFVFASLADVSSGNETTSQHESKRNHKKDAKLEYYLSRHVDHPDVDAETIQKHGASLEDAKMQADGLLEPKNKKVKSFDAAATGEETEAKLQEMAHHGEERQHPRRRHHRHEAKVHEESKPEGSLEEAPKKEGMKEKKMNKSRKNSELDNLKSEEVKVDGSKNAEPVKHSGGKRNHEKRNKGHKHGSSGHKNKKHGGKKSHKQLGKPSKDKKDKKMRKNNHHN